MNEEMQHDPIMSRQDAIVSILFAWDELDQRQRWENKGKDVLRALGVNDEELTEAIIFIRREPLKSLYLASGER